MNSRVLLFGGSGYLGTQVSAAFACDSRVSDLTCPGRDRIDLVTCDLADLVELVATQVPDAVVNCSGRLTGSCDELVLANTVVTAKLVEAVAVAAPRARLVRLGSAAEYAPAPHGHATAETDPAGPVSEYGVSHLAGTSLVELASAAGRVDGVVLRVFNPIGPGGADTLLGRATQQLAAALESGDDHITMGPLDAYRDLVDVRDVASAVLAAALAPSLPHRVFNVGSGRAVPTRHVVELLARAADFDGEIRESAPGSRRSASVGWACADIARAAAGLGWVPVHELAASAKAVWACRLGQAWPGAERS